MKPLATPSIDRLGTGVTQLLVGPASFPYLADHAFQGMVVLPGAFFVDAVLGTERELTGHVPRVLCKASFHNPVILSDHDSIIDVAWRDVGGGCVEYTFTEAAAANSGQSGPARPAARIVAERNATQPSERLHEAPFGDSAEIDGSAFYASLRANGNQYGPRFRRITSIRRVGEHALAEISSAPSTTEGAFRAIDPTLLDAMTQMLAPFVIDRGRTFVLRGIDRLELSTLDFPVTLACCASLRDVGARTDGLVGDVTALDQNGQSCIALRGVSYALLERVGTPAATPVSTCVIAANFTAEPLEDALAFWNDHFDGRLRYAFAPYNQVYQQLLDPQSAFARNRDGVNVLLLRLEEWAKRPAAPALAVDKPRVDAALGGRARAVLPNGLEIAHLNGYETDYLYKEIFDDECYLRHGVRLGDGDTVLDVGANIGLFSLFVQTRCRDPKIYAFEPAPLVHEILKANCAAYGNRVTTFNAGVSNARKTATFTFYENSSVFSGFHSDEAADGDAIRAVVRNMLQPIAGDGVDGYVDELTADRLRRQTYECPLVTISDVISDHGIERINLLKIDAEKSELDIIDGIDEHDWPKIDQIVAEIHDPTREALGRVRSLLEAKGFTCAVEQESMLDRAGLFNVYAVRPSAVDTAGIGAASAGPLVSDALSRNAQEFIAALRSFAERTSRPLILCFCPRTPRADTHEGRGGMLNDVERRITDEARAFSNVRVIASAVLRRRYPLADYYDPHGDAAAHMPYTREACAAIATAVVRAQHALARSPFKVIALDCDNTLWRGICGEDGVLGIALTPPRLALQEFMIERMNAGMLLCLCSRNNERDVMEVFERRAEMRLAREHFVATRINWDSKSRNIRSLAEELGVGLESFVFVDDSPFDCAEVRTHCPQVTTLQLPVDDESIAAFLEHAWPFDTVASTDEDRTRTRMYRESVQRERFREQAFFLEDYVEGLELRIDIDEVTDQALPRVSQLTFRTNQFNCTTRRRSEGQIREFLCRSGAHALMVRVADRFGDYGIVGVLMYQAAADTFLVDTFLLSCRVLGRGVEHAVLAALGKRAVEQGAGAVHVEFTRSQKNSPAWEFLASIGDRHEQGSATGWTFDAGCLAELRYVPAPFATDAASPDVPIAPVTAASLAFDFVDGSLRLQRIAENLRDVRSLAHAVEERRMTGQLSEVQAEEMPASVLQAVLRDIWRKVLGMRRIGLDDNFFEVGGTSLRAVQVLAMIKQDLRQTLSIVSLFECPTVRLLAARMSAGTDARPSDSASAAVQRGQNRRYNLSRQRGS